MTGPKNYQSSNYSAQAAEFKKQHGDMATDPAQPNHIEDGRYTLVYKTGDYRTVWVKTQPVGKWAAGQTILKLKQGHSWLGCAFLRDGNRLAFWSSFKAANTPQRLELIQRAVERIAADPLAAGMAFALKENRCCRCGAELTVPASLHRGMGPECYRKTIKKEDNRQAYLWRASQASASGGTQTTAPTPPIAPAPVSGSPGGDLDADWIAQKNEFAKREQEQESRACMSDPDVYNPADKFWSEPCAICKQPRNRCCC